MKKITTLTFLLAIILAGFSQGLTRDGFVEILGKKVDAPEVKTFFQEYGITNIAGTKYSSVKNGIDINTQKDTITTVNIYKDSPVYGCYKGKLSKGLSFGMIPAQAEQKLGKAKTTYTNSGYSEYVFPGYMITCWFEQGGLSQVSLSPK